MKKLTYLLSLIILATIVSCNGVKKKNTKELSSTTGESSRFDELANLPFEENRPTKETAQTLKDELFFSTCHSGIFMGHAAYQHTGHEIRF